MRHHGLFASFQRVQKNLGFQEAQAKMGEYNNLMNILSGGSQQAFGMAGGMGSAQLGAIGMMNNQSQLGSTLGGVMAGASAGSAAGPYGALIGGVAGGLGGYASSGG